MKVFLNTWIVWFLSSFFYAYQYILRVLPNIIMPDIMAKFHVEATSFGQFSGVYYLGYAGMHIPIGLLLDKKGPKLIIPICILLTIVGLLPLIYTDVWVYPLVGRALIGIGSSGAILGVFKIIRMLFEEEKFTRILGVSVTIGLLGAMYGGEPVNYLLKEWGWKTTLEAISLLGVILAVLTYIAIPAYKPERVQENVWSSVKAVLTNRFVLMVCVLAGLMVGPLEGFADVWGTGFFKVTYGMQDTLAASLPSLLFLGMCVGSPVLSWVADSTKAYFGVIVVSGVGMAIGFFMMFTGTLSTTLLTAVLFMIGVFCAYQIPAIYKASTFVAEENIGLTTAVANMIIMTFGYFFHGSIGFLMDSFWSGVVVNSVPQYSGETYVKALSIIPICLLVGSVGYGYLWVQERKKQTHQTV